MTNHLRAILKFPGMRSSSTVAFRRRILRLLIRAKWRRDKIFLPLVHDHWEIYQAIHQTSWRRLEKFPNLFNPCDFNDRIQWLKLFDQCPETVRCTGKLSVRDYIRSRTGDRYLTRIYQAVNDFGAIDFSSLPTAFVIKATHDSASAVLVRNKAGADYPWMSRHFEKCLGRTYGVNEGEWAYGHIPPQLIVEELINLEAGVPPSDFRFHCVNGSVCWIQMDVPFKPRMKEVTIEPDGRPIDVHFSTHKIHSMEFSRPAQWEEMCELARTLSKGWKYVRVDMFLSEGRIYAGEMTFFPYSGFYKGDGQKVMGQRLDFDRTTFRDPVYKRLPYRSGTGL